MILFPNCKINLGLHILRKRNDGFHDLETVFYPIQINDAIEVVDKGPRSRVQDPGSKIEEENKELSDSTRNKKQETRNQKSIQFERSGIPTEGNDSENICIKAFDLLKNDFPELPAVQMHLHKAIPVGAGLGGGSADGAFTLQLLNKKFNLGISQEKILDYALQLGSDCPFFIINKPCFATGRGEFLEPVHIDLSDYIIIVVYPGFQIQTAQAFSQFRKFVRKEKSVKEIIKQPLASWKYSLKNDFEEGLMLKYPLLMEIKNTLYNSGALYASISGSGSSAYGIFNRVGSPEINFPPEYFVKLLS